MHFRDAQKTLRRTRSLTINESINHAEIINLVQQGVQLTLVDKDSHKTSTNTEYANDEQ